MFYDKRDTIRDLEWTTVWQKDTIEAHQDTIDVQQKELSELRSQINGIGTTHEVVTVTYERDEEGLKQEIDEDIQEFKSLTDAVHFARNQRLYGEETAEAIAIGTEYEWQRDPTHWRTSATTVEDTPMAWPS